MSDLSESGSLNSVYDKGPWRNRNLSFIEWCRDLWDSRGLLKYSYYELVGLSGSEMYNLLAPKLHTPKQFIGADQDPEAIYYHRLKDVPWTTALVRDGYGKAEELTLKGIREDAGIEHPVAIYGFDDYASVGSKAWWETEASQLQHIVEKTLEQTGVCCLILNNTLDRPTENCTQSVEAHTARLCAAFGKFGARGAGLTEDMLLGPKRRFLSRVVKETGFFRGYDVYRSGNRMLRMATVRLEFTARKVRVWRGVGHG